MPTIREQMEEKYGKPTVRQVGSVRSQLEAKYKKQLPYQSESQGVIPTLSNIIKSRGEKGSEAILNGQTGGQSKISSALQVVGQGAGAVGDIGFEALKAVTPDFIQKPVGEAFAKGVTTVMGTKPVQAVAEKYGEFKMEHPEAAANLEATGLIASILPVGKVANVGTKGVRTLTKEGTDVALNLVKKTPQKYEGIIDKNVKKIFQNITGDASKIDDDMFKAKKGIELLQRESPTLDILDTKSPIGSNITKKLNIQKSTPNEIINGVNKMGAKISNIARESANTATKLGRIIDTDEALLKIDNAIKSGEVGKSIGNRLKLQIKTAGNTPLGIHDWVQTVNQKFYTKGGSLSDTATAKLANDVAENLRGKLNDVVDRSGYAEAYGNNQALKKMLVLIAKKANKSINFGDITTDAGVDAAISILTGNPLYMTRTMGSGLFKGVFSNIKNQSGIRSLKKAAFASSQLPIETRLPSTIIKNTPLKQQKILSLPAPKEGQPRIIMTSNGTIPLGTGDMTEFFGKSIPKNTLSLDSKRNLIKNPTQKDWLENASEYSKHFKSEDTRSLSTDNLFSIRNNPDLTNAQIQEYLDTFKTSERIEKEIANLKQERAMLPDVMAGMPGKQLVPFTNKYGELGEAGVGGKTIWAKKGDDILANKIGVKGGTSEAQGLLKTYQDTRSRYNEVINLLKKKKEEFKKLPRNDRSLSQ